MALRVGLADDSLLIREALARLLEGADGIELVACCVDADELRAAIEVVARGGSMIDPEIVRLLLESEERRHDSPLKDLTPREREVLAAMASGKSNAAIADELVLTKRAVEKHVGAIFLKLGLPGEDVVSRRVAAVLLYRAVDRL